MSRAKKIHSYYYYPLIAVLKILKWTRRRAPRLAKRLRVLLRAIGLGLLAVASPDEQPKKLVYKSRLLALAHCAVHLLPACVSFVVIVINLQGYFIGKELQGSQNQDGIKLGILQVAAKVQELLIIASLATMILHIVHSQMLTGDGVPLGLIGSAWAFPQVSFYWSTGFWGGAMSNSHANRQSKGRLLLALLIVSGLMGLLVGPATAVLMIPRKIDFPVGGGNFWLSESEAYLWPTSVNTTILATSRCSNDAMRLLDPACPSAGFLPLSQRFRSWLFRPDVIPCQFDVQDRGMRKSVYVTSPPELDEQTWAYTAHSPTANMQDAMRGAYRSALYYLKANATSLAPYPMNLALAQFMTFNVETKVPKVRTACLSNWNITINKGLPKNATVMPFPSRGNSSSYTYRSKGIWGSPTLYRYELKNVTKDIRDHLIKHDLSDLMTPNRTLKDTAPHLIAIPINLLRNSTNGLGLIIVRNVNNTDNWAVATCFVDGVWTTANSIVQGNKDDNMLSYDFVSNRVRNLVTVDLLPQKSDPRIYMNSNVYELLVPTISDSSLLSDRFDVGTPARSTLERLIEVSLTSGHEAEGSQNIFRTFDQARALEFVISVFFADALSRVGSLMQQQSKNPLRDWLSADRIIMNHARARSLVHRGNPKQIFPLPAGMLLTNSTQFTMAAIMTGYVLAAMDWFDYLSIALLMLYALIAFAYTAYVLTRGEFSEAWDSVPELLAIAHKSPSPDHPMLSNTCAGIRSLRTMGQIVIVEKSEPGGQTRTEEVALKVVDSVQSRRADLRVSPNTSYGVSTV